MSGISKSPENQTRRAENKNESLMIKERALPGHLLAYDTSPKIRQGGLALSLLVAMQTIAAKLRLNIGAHPFKHH